jgi:excinuclease ABC subunit C
VALDVLGAVPGIGDYRARRLLRRFGSVRAILEAPPADLAETPGVGPVSARAIDAAAR